MSEDASFTIWETHLFGRLGVGMKTIIAQRHELVEGVDWQKKGRRVLYSEKGVRRVMELLGIDKDSIPQTPPQGPEIAEGVQTTPSEKNAPPEGVLCADCPPGVHIHEPLKRDFQIWQACPNPIWVRAHAAGKTPRSGADLVNVLLRKKPANKNRGVLLVGCKLNDKNQWEY